MRKIAVALVFALGCASFPGNVDKATQAVQAAELAWYSVKTGAVQDMRLCSENPNPACDARSVTYRNLNRQANQAIATSVALQLGLNLPETECDEATDAACKNLQMLAVVSTLERLALQLQGGN